MGKKDRIGWGRKKNPNKTTTHLLLQSAPHLLPGDGTFIGFVVQAIRKILPPVSGHACSALCFPRIARAAALVDLGFESTLLHVCGLGLGPGGGQVLFTGFVCRRQPAKTLAAGLRVGLGAGTRP
jgi:hypothetical protein